MEKTSNYPLKVGDLVYVIRGVGQGPSNLNTGDTHIVTKVDEDYFYIKKNDKDAWSNHWARITGHKEHVNFIKVGNSKIAKVLYGSKD